MISFPTNTVVAVSQTQNRQEVAPKSVAVKKNKHFDCAPSPVAAPVFYDEVRPMTVNDPLVLGPDRTAPLTAKAYDGTHVRIVANAIQRLCDAETLNRLRAERNALSPALAAVLRKPPAAADDALAAAAIHDAIVGINVPGFEHLTVFHSVTYPEIALYDLACALTNNCGIDAHTHLVAFILMGRAVATLLTMAAEPSRPLHPTLMPLLHALRPSGGALTQTSGMPTAHMLHRLFVACVHVAVKTHWDRSWRTRSFARLAGVGTLELIAAEAVVIYMCDWRTIVTAGELDAIVESATLHVALDVFTRVPEPVVPLAPPQQLQAVVLPNALAFVPADAIGVDLTVSAGLEGEAASPLPAGAPAALGAGGGSDPHQAMQDSMGSAANAAKDERDAAYLAA